MGGDLKVRMTAPACRMDSVDLVHVLQKAPMVSYTIKPQGDEDYATPWVEFGEYVFQ